MPHFRKRNLSYGPQTHVFQELASTWISAGAHGRNPVVIYDEINIRWGGKRNSYQFDAHWRPDILIATWVVNASTILQYLMSTVSNVSKTFLRQMSPHNEWLSSLAKKEQKQKATRHKVSDEWNPVIQFTFGEKPYERRRIKLDSCLKFYFYFYFKESDVNAGIFSCSWVISISYILI